VSAVADHNALRTEAERIVGEDRVPVEVLERLVAECGGVESAARRSRPPSLVRRAAMLVAVAVRWLTDRHPVEITAALRLDGAEVIELFNAAYDAELATLDELVERAGLGWKCQAEVGGFPCHYMNVGAATCGGCGATEAQGKEDPDG